MIEGVERETILKPGGGIAKAIGDESVGKFVDSDGNGDG